MKLSRKIPIATVAGVLVLLSAGVPVRQAHAGNVDCDIAVNAAGNGITNTCNGGTDNITNGTVDNADLATDAVDSTKIKDGEVKENNLAAGAVTTDKIAAGAVDSSKIKDGEVKTDDIGDMAVTTDKIGDMAVTTRKIGDMAVTTRKIANKAVTTDKIAEDAVTFGKLGAGVRKRITDLEEDVEDANAGVAMAVALASAPIVPSKNASFSIGGGMFKNEYGGAARLAIRLHENAYLTVNGTAGTNGLYAAGAGLGVGF